MKNLDDDQMKNNWIYMQIIMNTIILNGITLKGLNNRRVNKEFFIT